uniref:Uncharacterized protein n=1 Tax=Glossina palpalis gambiensis TaxID=67801 RepID=A0A1B0B2J4_9MUSC
MKCKSFGKICSAIMIHEKRDTSWKYAFQRKRMRAFTSNNIENMKIMKNLLYMATKFFKNCYECVYNTCLYSGLRYQGRICKELSLSKNYL